MSLIFPISPWGGGWQHLALSALNWHRNPADRKVYRCKVAAVAAGQTSTSARFPSPSWRTSSASVQTCTASRDKHIQTTGMSLMNRHVWNERRRPAHRHCKSQHHKDEAEPDLHLWKCGIICFPLGALGGKQTHRVNVDKSLCTASVCFVLLFIRSKINRVFFSLCPLSLSRKKDKTLFYI